MPTAELVSSAVKSAGVAPPTSLRSLAALLRRLQSRDGPMQHALAALRRTDPQAYAAGHRAAEQMLQQQGKLMLSRPPAVQDSDQPAVSLRVPPAEDEVSAPESPGGVSAWVGSSKKPGKGKGHRVAQDTLQPLHARPGAEGIVIAVRELVCIQRALLAATTTLRSAEGSPAPGGPGTGPPVAMLERENVMLRKEVDEERERAELLNIKLRRAERRWRQTAGRREARSPRIAEDIPTGRVPPPGVTQLQWRPHPPSSPAASPRTALPVAVVAPCGGSLQHPSPQAAMPPAASPTSDPMLAPRLRETGSRGSPTARSVTTPQGAGRDSAIWGTGEPGVPLPPLLPLCPPSRRLRHGAPRRGEPPPGERAAREELERERFALKVDAAAVAAAAAGGGYDNGAAAQGFRLFVSAFCADVAALLRTFAALVQRCGPRPTPPSTGNGAEGQAARRDDPVSPAVAVLDESVPFFTCDPVSHRLLTRQKGAAQWLDEAQMLRGIYDLLKCALSRYLRSAVAS